MTCPSCGAVSPEGARFCSSCGHALVFRPDERRLATVLFADLVGFTTFSETADPERVKDLVDRCFERLAADVDTFGGQVDKIVGDAIVALFGAPIAHEDDAERAVRAGLRMQQTLAELRDLHRIGAEIRVGINTGEVLVGALRAGGDYTALGDVVNTASRLQAMALPGQVLVGPSTYEATRDQVRYEPVGLVALRGREEPIEVWRAQEPVTSPGQRPTRRSPLIGRDAELEVLRTVCRTTAERRRAHLVLLTGEAGVGKTRLARELGRHARDDHGATVLLGHCAPYGEANVWFPIGEALRKACGIDDCDSIEETREKCRETALRSTPLHDGDPELGRVVDGLLYLMGVSAPTDAVDPARARDDALRSFQTLLEGMSENAPVVLALADLHWADHLVLDVIDRLMEHLRHRPFLLAATARPELSGRWNPRPGRHNALSVHLEPLDETAGAELARALLGSIATDALIDTVLERSGGNPLFIEELSAMMSEAPDGSTTHVLPGTLHGLVAARLDALAPEERMALEDCAVIGTVGAVEFVVALAQGRSTGGASDAATAHEGLRLLADRDLLDLDGNEFRFRTELVREVAYGTLTKAERARRHAALSKHLAERARSTGRVEELLDQLAHHYGAAADLLSELGPVEGVPPELPEHAIEFLEQAAVKAEQQETWLVAGRLRGMGLKVVDPGDDVTRCHLYLRRARARAELRDCEGARADLELGAALATRLGDRIAEATALTLRGDIEFKEGDSPGSVSTLIEAVELWRELDDPRGLGTALRAQGMTDLFLGNLEAAEESFTEALACFRSVDNRRGVAAALQNLAWISFYRADFDIADQRLNESATTFAEVGDWGGLGWAFGLLAWVRFGQGQLDEAERLATDVITEASELGNMWATGIMRVLLANVTMWRGRHAVAAERAEEARLVFVEIGDAWGELQAIAGGARALLCLGRTEEAKDAVASLTSAAARLPNTSFQQFPELTRLALAVHAGAPDAGILADTPESDVGFSTTTAAEQRTAQGLAWLQSGAIGRAISACEAAWAVTKVGETKGSAAASAVALGLVYVAAGRPDEALHTCDQVSEYLVTYLDYIQDSLVRGFAALQLGDEVASDAAFARAVQLADDTDSPLDQGLVRLARAVAWKALQREGAVDAHREATGLLAAIGLPAKGWERAYTLAAAGGKGE